MGLTIEEMLGEGSMGDEELDVVAPRLEADLEVCCGVCCMLVIICVYICVHTCTYIET